MKDPTLAKNCRPVSALPAISKVFEQIIQKQLTIINSYWTFSC